ncbi:unnamed protein product [Pleuronectes platessa]|uniref:Uncharacterized protein n=1 Tax=Pleuronectes platessa TaxID=8262 RepID=A0A9N7U1J3_PLEPL|nr:unnamed protein product [Pleuronectes platessa]
MWAQMRSSSLTCIPVPRWVRACRLLRDSRCSEREVCRWNKSVSSPSAPAPPPSAPPPAAPAALSRTCLPGARSSSSSSCTWRCSSEAQLLPLSGAAEVGDARAHPLRIRSHPGTASVTETGNESNPPTTPPQQRCESYNTEPSCAWDRCRAWSMAERSGDDGSCPARTRTHTHTHARGLEHGGTGSRSRHRALTLCVFLVQSFSKLQITHLAAQAHAHRSPPLAQPVLRAVADWSVEVSLPGHELCPLRTHSSTVSEENGSTHPADPALQEGVHEEEVDWEEVGQHEEEVHEEEVHGEEVHGEEVGQREEEQLRSGTTAAERKTFNIQTVLEMFGWPPPRFVEMSDIQSECESGAPSRKAAELQLLKLIIGDELQTTTALRLVFNDPARFGFYLRAPLRHVPSAEVAPTNQEADCSQEDLVQRRQSQNRRSVKNRASSGAGLNTASVSQDEGTLRSSVSL